MDLFLATTNVKNQCKK